MGRFSRNEHCGGTAAGGGDLCRSSPFALPWATRKTPKKGTFLAFRTDTRNRTGRFGATFLASLGETLRLLDYLQPLIIGRK